MAAMPVSRLNRSRLALTPSDLVLPFLAPSIRLTRPAPVISTAQFSTSPALCKRKDNNKIRGVSAQRHTGLRPRQTLTVGVKDLPKPRLERDAIQGAPDHGLWAFFKNKELLQKPEDENGHGRAWTIQDLRNKSWNDLHCLWWICVKERNRLATEKIERARIGGLYGDAENEARDETAQETMKAIQDTLLERYNAWDDAFNIARHDPEIDLSGTGPSYNPYAEASPYETQELEETAEEVAEQGKEQRMKDLPAPDFFNTPENPPSVMEKAALKTRKFLWNR